MKKNDFSFFPSKLLLFGEYTVIHGGEALAIPIQNFKGRLKMLDTFDEHNIAPFIQYLGALPNITLDQDLIEALDLDRLIFESDIPTGYGVGSSGALTAAVYDAFVLDKQKDPQLLREDLATMEGFFHGTSSGSDPLISYLKKNILFKKGSYDILGSEENIRESIRHFYLVDTLQSRKTEPLVALFNQKLEFSNFEKVCMEPLLQYNKEAITGFLDYNIPYLSNAISEISLLQYRFFEEMIPMPFMEVWENLLDEEGMTMKLCGAGGGGFLLFFAENDEVAESWLDDMDLDYVQIMHDSNS